MIGEIILTAQQTGSVPVVKAGDRLYNVAGVIVDIDAIARATGQVAGETQQEHASVILMALCLPDCPPDVNID